jgi:type I restriction enzyme M protein
VTSPAPLNPQLSRAAKSIEDITVAWQRPERYVLSIVLLRYLSAWHEITLADYTRKYRGDQLRIDRAMSRERFVVPRQYGFANVRSRLGDTEAGETINSALAGLDLSNPNKLGGLFADVDFNSTELGMTAERNARIRDVFAAVDALGRDSKNGPVLFQIRTVAELLLDRFAQSTGHNHAYFSAPTELGALITRLVEPASGERIYDPACGTAGFLIQAAAAIRSEDFALYGHEPNRDAWALSTMNLILHDLDSAHITGRDPIEAPFATEDGEIRKFDVVLADLPFSRRLSHPNILRYDRHNRFKRGTPSAHSIEYVLISHIVESLHATTGRACVLAPLGTLFRGGSEGLIRKALIDEGRLECVVRLPPNLLVGTAISAALLLFRAKRPSRDIFLIDASRKFDAEDIFSSWKARKDIDHYARLVSHEEIAANDFNLNIPLYIKPPVEHGPDFTTLAANVLRLEKDLARAHIEMVTALSKLRK